MGKNLTQQARGRGGPSFTAPSFRYLGEARVKHGVTSAEVLDVVKSQGHLAPLLSVKYNDGTTGLMIAPEGSPKTTNDKKVAVITRYDMVMEISNASLTKGTKNALMPRAKPRTANMEPMSIIGTNTEFLLLAIV